MNKRGPKASPLNPALDPAVRLVFERIEQSGMSLFDGAEISGVGRTTMGHWRRGRSSPTLPLFRAVANTVGLDLEVAHAKHP